MNTAKSALFTGAGQAANIAEPNTPRKFDDHRPGAKELRQAIAELAPAYSLLPTSNRKPCLSWKQLQAVPLWPDQFYQYDFDGLGLICGFANVEAVDIDVKNDPSGKIARQYFAAVHQADNSILPGCLIQYTKSGGYHIIYRCREIEGNQVLAKSALGRAIIETRGQGGFVHLAPSPGYAIIKGSFPLKWLTPGQREILLSKARELSQGPTIPTKSFEARSGQGNGNSGNTAPRRQTSKEAQSGLINVFRLFCLQYDPGDVLNAAGWKYISNDAAGRELWQRPGKKGREYSANIRGGSLMIWTSSTEFEPGRAYSAADAYAILFHGSDLGAASKYLFAQFRQYANDNHNRSWADAAAAIEANPRKEGAFNL